MFISSMVCFFPQRSSSFVFGTVKIFCYEQIDFVTVQALYGQLKRCRATTAAVRRRPGSVGADVTNESRSRVCQRLRFICRKRIGKIWRGINDDVKPKLQNCHERTVKEKKQEMSSLPIVKHLSEDTN